MACAFSSIARQVCFAADGTHRTARAYDNGNEVAIRKKPIEA
jgi:hypothetical protein